MNDRMSRRALLRIAGSAGVAVTLPTGAKAQPAEQRAPQFREAGPGSPARQNVRLFFNNAEAEFVTAAVDRLIPADDRWPGASEAGVVDYIDHQLAGAYGAGARLYLDGPFMDGTPEQGYQLPYTPAELYRVAIRGILRHLEQNYGGRGFHQLEAGTQDEILRGLESGLIELPDVPSAVFFETLLANAIEGFLSDPAYGGNWDMVGWRMIGFPGAYAAYVELVEHHGIAFDQPPISMAETLHEHGGPAQQARRHR